LEQSRHKVQNGHQSASRANAFDRFTNRKWDNDPMGNPVQDTASVGMSTQPITVRELMGEHLNYQFNGDLCAERCKGESRGIGGGPHANVEVLGRGQELHTDAIAAIESLMVVRDALRKLAAVMA
jgi:hypothetical protein